MAKVDLSKIEDLYPTLATFLGLLVLFLFYFWASTTPTLSACSNRTFIIVKDKVTKCKPEKSISGLEVNNEIAVRDCVLESNVTINMASVCACECKSQSGTCDPNPVHYQDRAKVAESNSSSLLNLAIYEHAARTINSIHINLLQRRIKSGKWAQKVSEEDLSFVLDKDRDILDATFISIKFIAFSSNQTSDAKASYVGNNTYFRFRGLKGDTQSTFSKYWTLPYPPASCSVPQNSEVVVIPLERKRGFMYNWYGYPGNNTLESGRCAQVSGEPAINSIVAEKMPFIIYSILLCH